MSLLDELKEIQRISSISVLNHFFERWLGYRDFVTYSISDADLEKLLESILQLQSYVNRELGGDAE